MHKQDVFVKHNCPRQDEKDKDKYRFRPFKRSGR